MYFVLFCYVKGIFMEFYRRMPDENLFIDIIEKWAIDIILVIVIGVFISLYICSEEKIIGNSMASGLNSSEKVFVNTLSYDLFSPQRYDVIKFYSTTDDGVEETYIKRIIGLPGETVQIKDGRIFINDKQLKYNEKEEKIVNAGLANEPITLKSDEYFVIGDKWNSSEDSRFKSIGNVQKKNIAGKVWLRVSPFARIGFID